MNIISTPLYISTTRRCNLSCEYCHLPKDKRDSYICDEGKLLYTVNRLVREIELNDIVYQTVVLHGAECTTLSIETLSLLCNKLSRIALIVSLQSNMLKFADLEYTLDFYNKLDDPTYISIGAS
jgi:MoaA/NifB/PqqE/SkfB family radical SAM enzyme